MKKLLLITLVVLFHTPISKTFTNNLDTTHLPLRNGVTLSYAYDSGLNGVAVRYADKSNVLKEREITAIIPLHYTTYWFELDKTIALIAQNNFDDAALFKKHIEAYSTTIGMSRARCRAYRCTILLLGAAAGVALAYGTALAIQSLETMDQNKKDAMLQKLNKAGTEFLDSSKKAINTGFNNVRAWWQDITA